jgi:hypothetical protein
MSINKRRVTMRKNKSVSSTGITLCIALFLLLGVAMPVFAQDCRLIRIQGLATQTSIRVEPETLSISKGTCVIWFNRASAQEVKIIFEEGKRCASVSEAPVGFSLDHENCYVTSWIPFGGTSSLRFQESGTYEYVLEAKTVPQKNVKGTIIVE